MHDTARERTGHSAARHLDGTIYRKVAGHWLTGVAIITSTSPQALPVGLTMNAVAPLSLVPPQFLVNLDLKSDTYSAIGATRHFCINFLRADQGAVCAAFARKGADKFKGVAHHSGVLGVPIIEGCIAHVECSVSAMHTSGDHVIVIGDAYHGAADGGEPLVYYTSGFRQLAPCL